MKKYTYNDWLEGKLILKYDYFMPDGVEPTTVEWDNFNDEDILLIKEKQKEIFEEKVNTLLEYYKSVFNKERENSKDFIVLCKSTLNQIDVIFNGELPVSDFITTDFWGCVFTYKGLSEIQECYKKSIIRGVGVDYSFINSPNVDYQTKELNAQTYAHALHLFSKWIESDPTHQEQTKMDKIKADLCEYGFFELLEVKHLSLHNKYKLIELIITGDLPYSIAMLDYLGFIEHLKNKHFKTHNELFKRVGELLGGKERSVRGNINVLNTQSKEDRKRYTAHTYKQIVQNDYKNLK